MGWIAAPASVDATTLNRAQSALIRVLFAIELPIGSAVRASGVSPPDAPLLLRVGEATRLHPLGFIHGPDRGVETPHAGD